MATVASAHIEKIDGQPARLLRLPRIRVAQIAMDYLAHGWSPDEMCRHHSHLMPAEAYAAMAYYYDHQAEIDGEIEAELAEVQAAKVAASPTPFVIRMRANGR
ncbi:MAG TPA: DUF433 domain-containing protein [Lacipirellula sp.]